ncbi:DUF4302 domain-containing protein [Myroides odoratimimus]|uniref:DUF4302 domain-containing protein n=1 Tax=Myroides odoratimimus TaxID=76832 RepID=A0AAI8C3C8_9FLAO|nr:MULTISPECIES: DUF4302 domain-containing protein [Myroides]ALU25359.1 hypothetical protein AS202_03970 [Myroides odoratimimus]APA91368.1 hypothetical protein BK054_03850 [Myroides sp. ZB35]EHO05082.1 hypothetical protein HMPREF9714_03445 [Myroides odoratimimus CCUG 12901]EKB02947.1 hypothetical protein HMPREF9711_03024 [Myroides odoratimimus CCUG 3837]MCA4791625.1 DUF4302 domain-containing protein [Myroides odoratimimus]
MKKYIAKAFLATIILAGVVSCQKEEDRVFDKSVAERLSEQEKKLKDLLLSSEYGWRVVYFTDTDGLGGFTYLMRFKDARNVEMVSDFDLSGQTIENSEYTIQQRATTSLIFTTRTKIHELSDPINSPYESGQGYYGEYQFGYFGNTENEIHFRTAKKDREVVFVKATKEDWENFKSIPSMIGKMSSLDKPYFRTLQIKTTGEVKAYDLAYSPSVRFIEIEGGDNVVDGSAFGISFNPQGIKVAPALKVGSDLVTQFDYNAKTGDFEYNANGNFASIQYSFAPINTYSDYKKVLNTPEVKQDRLFQFQSNTSLINSKSNSPLFLKMLNDLGKTALGGYNLDLIIFNFNDKEDNGESSYIRYRYKGVNYYYEFKNLDGDIAVKVAEGKWYGGAARVPQELQKFNHGLMQENIFVKQENFKIQYSNPVVTFIGSKEGIAFSTWDVGVPKTF